MPATGTYIAPGRLVGPTTEYARREVRRLLASVAAEVADLPAPTLRELMPVLKTAQRELERDLMLWLQRIDDGGQRFTSFHYRAFLRQTRQAMKTIGEIAPRMATALERGSVRAAGLSNRVLSKEMARLSRAFGDPANLVSALPEIDIPTVGRLLERNNWLIRKYPAKSRRYTEKAQQTIRRQMAVGVTRGETIDQLALRVMKLRPRPGGFFGLQAGSDAVARDMSAGLFKGRYWDAERLVRTELMNVYNAHHQVALSDWTEEEPDAMKRWDASSDRHCMLCRDMDGRTVAVGESFPFGNPPRHPNCRCLVTPWMRDWPEVKPLRGGPGKPVVTRGGTAKETNRVLERRRRRD